MPTAEEMVATAEKMKSSAIIYATRTYKGELRKCIHYNHVLMLESIKLEKRLQQDIEYVKASSVRLLQAKDEEEIRCKELQDHPRPFTSSRIEACNGEAAITRSCSDSVIPESIVFSFDAACNCEDTMVSDAPLAGAVAALFVDHDTGQHTPISGSTVSSTSIDIDLRSAVSSITPVNHSAISSIEAITPIDFPQSAVSSIGADLTNIDAADMSAVSSIDDCKADVDPVSNIDAGFKADNPQSAISSIIVDADLKADIEPQSAVSSIDADHKADIDPQSVISSIDTDRKADINRQSAVLSIDTVTRIECPKSVVSSIAGTGPKATMSDGPVVGLHIASVPNPRSTVSSIGGIAVGQNHSAGPSADVNVASNAGGFIARLRTGRIGRLFGSSRVQQHNNVSSIDDSSTSTAATATGATPFPTQQSSAEVHT